MATSVAHRMTRTSGGHRRMSPRRPQTFADVTQTTRKKCVCIFLRDSAFILRVLRPAFSWHVMMLA